jgi:hypothetical protein
VNSKGKGEGIKLLLASGADRNMKNKTGKSPLDIARVVTNFNLLQFFE